MNTKDVLIAARKKIERPECWSKRAGARTANGDRTLAKSQDAVCWCALGATWVLAGRGVDVLAAESALARALGGAELDWSAVAEFNDHPNTTHADVLALFDRAIAACKEE